ncbi:MAG: hypothetical protein NXY57DRAFT_351147 [Lentinula lateritia]|nr:MAG: hypothetical protein NXY57DRAFT_351147 [Lentinula lateritia]
MPAPAVYVIAVLGTVAVGFAFKEYVYDPHIKPKVRQWQTEFAAGREARRRRRMPVAVSVPVNHNTDSDDSDEESDSGKSRGYEMETLNPTQVRTRTRTLSREGIESWRTGIQSTISATTLRKRNTATTSTMPADSRSLISPSSSTLVDRSRQTRELTPLIPIQTGSELGNEMNTHILTDVDTETISDSTSPSTSSIRQLPSEASIISTFDFNAPETPAPSSTIMISTDHTGTSFEQLDVRDVLDLSSLSSLGSLQNLARVSNPVGPATAVDPPSNPNNNPFLDPNSSPLTTPHASSPLNHSTYPTYPTYLTTQPDMWSSNPSITESSTSSPSMVPSLSLSYPIARADIEDGVVLLSPPSSDAYSSYSVPTSRAMSPAVSEAFTSLSGVSEVSRMSMPASASASVESLSDFSDFSVLESASDRSGPASRIASPLLSTGTNSRPAQQAMQTMSITGGRLPSMSRLGGSSLSVGNDREERTPTGRHLSREEIQHLIDTHSTRRNREA